MSWTQRCVQAARKFHHETARNPSINDPFLASRCSLQKQLTQRVAAIELENPTSNLQRASRLGTQRPADTLLESSDMDKNGQDGR